MPAWSEARRAGQTARQSQVKQRSDPRHNYGSGWYKFDADDRMCLFCRRRRSGMTTGYMLITGRIWKCKGCESRYEEEKIWEEQHK